MTAVVLFAIWTLIVLVLGVGVHRWTRILTGAARITDWPADQPHGPPRYRRIVRAHANCVENLPVFAAIAFAAQAIGYSSPLLEVLAAVVVVARVGQTVAHVASGSDTAVSCRFAFFAAQLVALFTMAGLVLSAIG